MLQDILYHAEMDKYFLSLPNDIQAKIRDYEKSINSSNDLYVYAENLLRNNIN